MSAVDVMPPDVENDRHMHHMCHDVRDVDSARGTLIMEVPVDAA